MSDLFGLDVLERRPSDGMVRNNGGSDEWITAHRHRVGRRMSAVEELVAMWEADAEEHLNTWGQHLPCSVSSMAEMLREAMAKDAAA